MIKIFPVRTNQNPWEKIAEGIPYSDEAEALQGAARLLQSLGSRIVWMKNGEPHETKGVDPTKHSICIYDPAMKIGVIVSGAALTDEEGGLLPMNQETGPHHLS